MENIISFKKEVKFDTFIYEINDIHLDLDYQVNNYVIDGNYLINGTYKDSEIKVGYEAFNYKIPFSVELDNNIVIDTLTFNIDDFNYEFKDNILILKIDNLITYEEYDEPEEDLFKEIEEDLRDDDNNILEVEEESNQEEVEDGFITYKIHIVRENETLDEIALLYNVSKSTILAYNKEEIKAGIKLIIPNEE